MTAPLFRKTIAFDDAARFSLAAPEAACDAAGFRAVVGNWRAINPSEYFALAADGFSASELDAAQAALIEDGVFLSVEWMGAYLGRDFPMPEGGALRFTRESLARAAVKFGWAVAYTAELAAGATDEFEVDFSATPAPATPLEHLFIAMGLQSRGVAFVALALRMPGSFEAAVDLESGAREFARAVADHAAVARLAGKYRLSFSRAEEKFAALPAMARECGDLLHVKTSGLAWMAGLRAIARAEPALFRELLRAAQERFAFDKVGAAISTNEEDVRFLPEVSDTELERTFLEDPRGRQMLHVAARSLSDHPPLRAALAAHAILHRELFAESVARHLAALRALPSPEAAT